MGRSLKSLKVTDFTSKLIVLSLITNITLLANKRMSERWFLTVFIFPLFYLSKYFFGILCHCATEPNPCFVELQEQFLFCLVFGHFHVTQYIK